MSDERNKEVFMIKVKVQMTDGASLPEYQSKGSAGADLRALLKEPVTLSPGKTKLIPTGIFIEIPEGYEAQIRPRSGLALKYGITFLNSPGTIDSDYRGEIKIIMTNFGEENFIIENGMRIGQIVFARVFKGEFIKTDELNTTERNEGGFGHSGI
jgi:dUTP pyrophosphatase